MSGTLQRLGAELVENAQLSGEFSAQRGLINELFPYVYEASKRMSSRAISRWLAEKGTKLSPATIAKALRNPKQYWQELAEEIEPAANVFGNAHKIEVQDLLTNRAAFDVLSQEPPSVGAATHNGVFNSLDKIQAATEKLRDEWFALPESATEACFACANWDWCDSEAESKKEGTDEKQ